VSELRGLDNWIQNETVYAERELELDDECPTCGYTKAEWRGETACNDKFHAEPRVGQPKGGSE
jgi:hypothetical protein